MSITADTIVVGAGLTGLTVARGLAASGSDVVVLDKGRGSGGRLATRRAGALRFDHGAQYIRPRDTGFAAFMAGMMAAGAVAPWPEVGTGALVGQPGMSALVKPLAAELTLHSGAEVAGLSCGPEGWRLTDAAGAEIGRARRLVLTVPSPQAQRLLDTHPFAARLDAVDFAPCWTLMAAFESSLGLPDASLDPEADLGWIARDSSKPGRPDAADAWVAQASAGWSRANLERDKDDICGEMMLMLGALVGRDLPVPVHAAAHRWRYAQAATPLGEACLHDDESGLVVAGDWCLGDRAEHAWLSAQAVLSALGVTEFSA